MQASERQALKVLREQPAARFLLERKVRLLVLAARAQRVVNPDQQTHGARQQADDPMSDQAVAY